MSGYGHTHNRSTPSMGMIGVCTVVLRQYGPAGAFDLPTCPDMEAPLKLQGHGIPERLHPKSFRAVFGFNTNIWATRDPQFVRFVQGPPVGVIDPLQPMNSSWFVTPSKTPPTSTLAGRTCEALHKHCIDNKLSDAACTQVMLSHRCRCVKPSKTCEAAYAVVEKCTKAGLTPYRD